MKGEKILTVNTYPDNGAILSGMTRDSILQIIPKYFPKVNIDISPLHINSFCDMHNRGELIGAFVSGTASVIGKVASIEYNEKTYEFEYEEKCFIDQLKKTLVDIQLGKIDSDFTEVIKFD